MNKELMKKEAESFLLVLFALPEVEKVKIKDVFISSIDDCENLLKGLNECFHDKYSDIDITAYVKLHPSEYNHVTLFYKEYFWRLGFQDRILGVIFNARDNGVEFMRICLTSGMRFDFACHCRLDEKAPIIGQSSLVFGEEKNKNQQLEPPNGWEMEKVDSFWFIAIQALGKLMRRDYLISSHLGHMLIMEGLVAQMILRNNQYNTNFHRYGYGEKLEYLSDVPPLPKEFMRTDDEGYNHIAELLFSAVISYDSLVPQLNAGYTSRKDVFLAIWRSYME